MAEHEACIGASDEWFTPPEIFAALELRFDLDPAAPFGGSHVPADRIYTKSDDGLRQPWVGMVWMNPPFGGRNGQVPWLQKFMAHGNGVALVAARTSAAWFHNVAVEADAMLFPRGKTKFLRPDGTVGGSPGTGIVLLARGHVCCDALARSGLGMFVDRRAG